MRLNFFTHFIIVGVGKWVWSKNEEESTLLNTPKQDDDNVLRLSKLKHACYIVFVYDMIYPHSIMNDCC